MRQLTLEGSERCLKQSETAVSNVSEPPRLTMGLMRDAGKGGCSPGLDPTRARGNQSGEEPREASENVIDGLHEVLALRFWRARMPGTTDSDSVELTFVA